MKHFSHRVDKLVRSFANKIDPKILKIYNTGAYFEAIDIADDKLTIDPFCTIDENGMYLPFKNLIFEHIDSVGSSVINDEVLYIGTREYFTFVTSSRPNILDSFTILVDDNMRMASKISTHYYIKDGRVALKFNGEPTVYFHYNNKWQYYDVNKTNNVEFNEYLGMFQEISNTVLEYLAVINNPKYFILEKKKISKIKSGKKKKKVSSSTFRIYKPREIKRKYNGNNDYVDGNGSPLEIGQERRGHWRVFKSDYFVNMKGKKKWINPYWAGPSSFTDPKDPNKHYIVRLDL